MRAESRPTLWSPMDYRPPVSSAHGIFEWVAMPSSRESSWPRNWTYISSISCIAGGFFTTEPSEKHP